MVHWHFFAKDGVIFRFLGGAIAQSVTEWFVELKVTGQYAMGQRAGMTNDLAFAACRKFWCMNDNLIPY